MINNITLVGRLVRDPELKYTTNGKPMARATMAVDRQFQKGETDFIPFVVWGKQAESFSNYMRKGSRVGVIGSLHIRQYEKDGQKTSFAEVNANDVRFLDSKNENQGSQQQNDSPYQPADNNQIDVGSGDLPF